MAPTTTVVLKVTDPPAEFVVEIWAAGAAGAKRVIDFPVVNGILQKPFEPVRGPVMRPRNELHAPEFESPHCTKIVLEYRNRGEPTQTAQHCYDAHPGAICVDLVYVEPTARDSNKTCTRRRACATAYSNGTYQLKGFRDYVLKYDGDGVQSNPPIMMRPDEYTAYESQTTYGSIDVSGMITRDTPIDTKRIRELARAWFLEEDAKATGSDDERAVWMNPIYACSRVTDCFPGLLIAYKPKFDASEEWWSKSLRVVNSRRPDLTPSAEKMIRVVKLWASTRPYVRDYILKHDRFHLGDDPSVLECQTANDCEDFAWHLLRAFHDFKTRVFVNPELVELQVHAHAYECFMVFGLMNDDAGATDESATGPLRAEAGHCYNLFVPLDSIRDHRIYGNDRVYMGEATNWQSPSLKAQWTVTPDLHAEINSWLDKFDDAIFWEHCENFSQNKTTPRIVVHSHAVMLLKYGHTDAWAFRAFVDGRLASIEDFTRATVELKPVVLPAPLVELYDESLKYERPMPHLGKWDETKAGHKARVTGGLARSLGVDVAEPKTRPVISFYVDLDSREFPFWNESTVDYELKSTEQLKRFVEWLRRKFHVSISPTESGHLVRLDCFGAP